MTNIDVELEALLKEDNSEVDTTSGAYDQNSGEDDTSPVEADTSLRAQERIRGLLEENKKLKEQTQPKETKWIDTIEDEGTRNLLKRTIEEAVQQTENRFKPLQSDFQASQFEKTFNQYSQIDPNLGKFKEELRKEFARNPDMNVKSRIGEIVLDLKMSRVNPLETKGSQSPRGGDSLNLDNASKEDLYALLEANRPSRNY